MTRDPAPAPVRRGWVAPRLLDPILAVAEWVDRRVRRITPVQPGAVLAIEHSRHRGSPLTLADGIVVRPGDRVDIIHFVNGRLRELAEPGWQGDSLAQAAVDLALLAERTALGEPWNRPVAFRGATILAAHARRMGFEQRTRTRTWWHRLEDWYLRSLLVRWSPSGRRRLRAGHSALGVSEVWISTGELLRRYRRPGSGAERTRSDQ